MQKAKQADFTVFDASAWRVGIVVAMFNRDITNQLLQSALARAKAYTIPDAQIEVIKVAGAVEIPLVLQNLAKSNKYDVLLAIGCVVEGETAHFDYVCKFVTDGVLAVQLKHNMPIGFGVLACRNIAQAKERAKLGGEHLDAVMHQVKVIKQI